MVVVAVVVVIVVAVVVVIVVAVVVVVAAVVVVAVVVVVVLSSSNNNNTIRFHEFIKMYLISIQAPEFPEFDAEVKKAIQKLGGKVFPKLNWSAPRVSWIIYNL